MYFTYFAKLPFLLFSHPRVNEHLLAIYCNKNVNILVKRLFLLVMRVYIVS